MGLPNVIVIGGQKCGSSAMHHCLDQHPDVQMSFPKELQFFSNPDLWALGPDWYKTKFEDDKQVTGEASPQYSWHPFGDDVPERMHQIVPDAKLIYMVRDPIERVISQWRDFVHQSWEKKPWEQVYSRFGDRPNFYIEPSRYYSQIEHYLRFFPAERLRVWSLEELAAEPLKVMGEVLEYLELDSSFTSEVWLQPRNPGAEKRRPHPLIQRMMKEGRPEQWVATKFPRPLRAPLIRLLHVTGSPIERPRLSPDEEAFMMDIFRDDVRRLREYTGTRFPGWRDY